MILRDRCNIAIKGDASNPGTVLERNVRCHVFNVDIGGTDSSVFKINIQTVRAILPAAYNYLTATEHEIHWRGRRYAVEGIAPAARTQHGRIHHVTVELKTSGLLSPPPPRAAA